MTDFSKMFCAGGLKVPQALTKRSTLKAPSSFQGPRELVLDGYCTPVENQGALPYCAAYSASSYAENILWRINGYHRDIDPVPLYKYAKTIDGDPDGDGTYLECALKALLEKGYFDKDRCRVRTFGSSLFGLGSDSGLNDLKYAIHKYGVCVAGFQITSEWFRPRNGACVTGSVKGKEGGHAVTICGYDENGVVVLNSWGEDYAHQGFVYVTNKAFKDQFMYGACLTNVFDGLK